MNNHIRTAILNGRFVLLLGAGASFGCSNRLKSNPPIGNALSKIIAEDAGFELEEGDDLADVYASGLNHLGEIGMQKLLEKYYKHCQPSQEYLDMMKYPFPRVYTFNIDDAIEKAAGVTTNKVFNVRRRNSRIEDFDPFFSQMDLVKLNGDINYPEEGFIFSPAQYGEGSAEEPVWYMELARDYHRFTFVFIGTKIKEPIFRHQIEKYKKRTGDQSLKSYLIVPELSSVQQNSLSGSNIEYINGTLSDFMNWMKDTFPSGLTPKDILMNTRPEMAYLSNGEEPTFSKSIAKALDKVVQVNRSELLKHTESMQPTVKEFYKGFKPTWSDIINNIPALLDNTKKIIEACVGNKLNKKLFLILGPAGSGKTTALKQLALEIADRTAKNCYYVEGIPEDLTNLLKVLNKRNTSSFYVFFEKLADIASDLSQLIANGFDEHAIFVGSENVRIWEYRVREHLEQFSPYIQSYESISEKDVDPILNKIELYGNWARLKKMSYRNRRLEILKKSKRQLLIGLIEATSGEGFDQIIKREFADINDKSERALLLLSGLATLHRSEASESTLTRALSYLGVTSNVSELCSRLSGLVNYNNGYVSTRHRIYVERLTSLFVDEAEMSELITAYIYSFSVYQFPIVVNISKKDAAVYKGLVNYKFLKKVLRDSKESILNIYSFFEKQLELEGLFLLQYGLALRAYGDNELALQKLINAREAFPESPHIEHAYAQQLLIIAENTSDTNLSLEYLGKAKDILNRLDKTNKHESDRYPIITLSISHVRILDKLGRESEAKIIAKQYFDELTYKFGKNDSKLNEMVIATKKFLTVYFTKGIIVDIHSYD
ncbi:P-loop NTPase [Klebsiella aerogenes]|uniref:P-loop NTPase n=5 Tax=Klebsiella aerogenes TaxID=548 RepID=UPI000377C2F3|nr:SIR2 family protein [Klebsiella aerogenes]EIX9031293.1 SIR2 family protein [Klebsiella aerogenes]EIX9085919.1 SIR2 family protein [Klebsiella aerogenes]EKJ9781690.1 SIR2 family protein [Klebsiella aerogenes]EKU5792308.1 SIR2 family protein [Klebsiella aerogenes]EKU6526377.1 SIR2 family protein [Klebsiella aerogenes]